MPCAQTITGYYGDANPSASDKASIDTWLGALQGRTI